MWPVNIRTRKNGDSDSSLLKESNEEKETHYVFYLRPGYVAGILGLVAFVIILAGMILQVLFFTTEVDNYLEYFDFLFNVDDELNIPAYFSSILLLSSSLLLAIITLLKFKAKDTYRSHWSTLALGFLFMAVDEMLTIHEHLNKPFIRLMGENRSSLFTFAWVIPGMIIVGLMGLLFLKFLINLPKKHRNAFILAGSIYVFGALGIEMIGANYADSHGLHNLTYSMITICEESCEMAGVIVFIWPLLVYIRDQYKEIRFHLD